MLDFTVTESLCTRCGLCVADCPTRIIEMPADAWPHIHPEKEAQCLQCQHCLAICPTAAVSILGRQPQHSQPLSPESLPRLDQMTRFVRGRRSFRQYKKENVPPALLGEILATLANVPTGVNRRELTFLVLDDQRVMQNLREKVYSDLSAAARTHRLPERAGFLQHAVTAYREQGHDLIFRTAPHALIVCAPPDAPCPHEDVTLAVAYFELLAQSAGLGTVWWGLLRMVLETSLPELKPLLGIPPKYHYGAMLFGLPAIQYQRTVQRDDAACIRRVTLQQAEIATTVMR